jgi:hypothetical protein
MGDQVVNCEPPILRGVALKDRSPPENEPALAGGSGCHGPHIDGLMSGKA